MNDDRPLVHDYLRTRSDLAFRALYRRHAPALHALALRLVGGSAADAEDALQETWLRAAAGLTQFRWESSLRTWLCGIAVNCAREVRRRRGDSAPPGVVALRPARADPVAERMDLERAIAGLAEGYREILLLHDVHGYAHREIAQLLQITEMTSRSQLTRARRAVRLALGPRAGSDSEEDRAHA